MWNRAKTDCASPVDQTQAAVEQACNGRSDCLARPRNTADPCPNIYKYLTVKYTCELPSVDAPNLAVGCDGDVMQLSCPAPHRIKVRNVACFLNDRSIFLAFVLVSVRSFNTH